MFMAKFGLSRKEQQQREQGSKLKCEDITDPCKTV
jgi:hypothetical protein